MYLALSIGDIWSKVWPFIIAILFFELIIIIHELGHFVAAKANGVKVEEFAVGMGPKIISFVKGETRYSLRLFLIGGYCAMEGEDEESDSQTSFSNKKVWRRIIIVVAGALCNLVLGFILVIAMNSGQDLVGTTKIAQFTENSVSSGYGLQAGDEIKSINGMRVFASVDISTGLSRDSDGVVDFVVKRGDKTVNLDGVKFDTEMYESGKTKRQMIKLDFYILGEEKNVGNVLRESFKETVGLGRSVFLSVYDIITGKYSLSELSGPVGTVTVVAQTASISMYALLRIMALISVNIGLFNLFPIPALDGWRLFTLLFEGILHKPLNKKLEYAINGAGLVLLMLLMLVITFSDITKLI